MTISDYLERIKERILFDPVVDEFHVIRERMTATDGYIRVKMSLDDGGMLESAEYVQDNAEGEIELVTYSHYWANADSEMLMRWDNTPHFPDLPNFPNHVHDGRSGTVRSSVPMSIRAVFIERLNGTFRSRMPRFVRRTRRIARMPSRLEREMFWSGAVYNFCTVHRTVQGTPAMAAGLTDTVWSVG